MNAVDDGTGLQFEFEETRRYVTEIVVVVLVLLLLLMFVFSFRHAERRQILNNSISEGLGLDALPEFIGVHPFHLEGNFVWALVSLKHVGIFVFKEHILNSSYLHLIISPFFCRNITKKLSKH